MTCGTCGYDDASVMECSDWFHVPALSSTPWGFGTVLQLEPGQARYAVEPERRYMILTTAAMGQPWKVLALQGPAIGMVLTFTSLVGLERVK